MTDISEFVIVYDIGTTAGKACLYRLGNGIEQVAEATGNYGISFTPDGGAEQNPDELWHSVCTLTASLLVQSGLKGEDITAVSFCSQMQAAVFVNRDGQPLRPAMNYMDERAAAQFRRFNAGIAKSSGLNLRKALLAIKETGIAAASVKDPVYKYMWVRDNEPEIFGKIYKYLDIGSYMLYRCTGRYVATEDIAYGSLLYSPKQGCWSRRTCSLYGVEMAHLPEVVQPTDIVGVLTAEAAAELGLSVRCRVGGGGGDVAMIAAGAGCVRKGDTLVYIGTSGWVSICTNKPKLDVAHSMAAVLGSQPGIRCYFALMELAGKCLEWGRDCLLAGWTDSERTIERFLDVAAQSPPGANGVIFNPYLLGCRCPFEDAAARAAFQGIGLETSHADLCRAVVESIAYHMCWMIELAEKKVAVSSSLRIAGGGARSDLLCRIIADSSGKTTVQMANPQNVGTLGSAIVLANSLGVYSCIEDAAATVQIKQHFNPNPETAAVYAANAIRYRQRRKNY